MLTRSLLGIAALIALSTGPLSAESHDNGEADAAPVQSSESDAATEAADAPQLEEMVDVDIAEVAAETLTGARVYDQNDEWVGEISEIIKAGDNTASEAIVDVGGFLGIGEKSVSLNVDDLTIKSSGDGNYTVHVALTQAEMEAMPTFSR